MKTAIFLNDEQIETLIMIIDREIGEDENYIEVLHGEEFDAWNSELNDLRELKVILNKKGVEKRDSGFVIQELQKRIDDMIDGQIDDAIAKRHGVEI